MPYDMSERGKAFRAQHSYKRLASNGGTVEFEFKFCADLKCSCNLAEVGEKEAVVELTEQ